MILTSTILWTASFRIKERGPIHLSKEREWFATSRHICSLTVNYLLILEHKVFEPWALLIKKKTERDLIQSVSICTYILFIYMHIHILLVLGHLIYIKPNICITEKFILSSFEIWESTHSDQSRTPFQPVITQLGIGGWDNQTQLTPLGATVCTSNTSV